MLGHPLFFGMIKEDARLNRDWYLLFGFFVRKYFNTVLNRISILLAFCGFKYKTLLVFLVIDLHLKNVLGFV